MFNTSGTKKFHLSTPCFSELIRSQNKPHGLCAFLPFIFPLLPHHMNHSFVISSPILPLSRSVSSDGVVHEPVGLPSSWSSMCICSVSSMTRLDRQCGISYSPRATRPLRWPYNIPLTHRHSLAAPAKNGMRCESATNEDDDATTWGKDDPGSCIFICPHAALV
jgi:hypothetical protein